MATQTILIDDIDGSVLDVKLVRLGFDGANYELDLGPANRAALKAALEPYLGAARTRSTHTNSKPSSRRGGVRRRGLSEWAAANGYEYSSGRVSAELAAAYDAAHSNEAA